MRRRGQISYHSQKNHQFAAQCKGHIRQRDALDMFDEIRGSDLTVPAATMSMAGSRTEIMVGRSATKWLRLNGYRRGRETASSIERPGAIPALGNHAACRGTGDVHGGFSELLLKMTLSTEVMTCDD